jgi:hypothetical protein
VPKNFFTSMDGLIAGVADEEVVDDEDELDDVEL